MQPIYSENMNWFSVCRGQVFALKSYIFTNFLSVPKYLVTKSIVTRLEISKLNKSVIQIVKLNISKRNKILQTENPFLTQFGFVNPTMEYL